MSINNTLLAWQAPLPPTEKLFLLALAECSGDNGDGTSDFAYPMGRMTTMTGLSADTIDGLLRIIFRSDEAGGRNYGGGGIFFAFDQAVDRLVAHTLLRAEP